MPNEPQRRGRGDADAAGPSGTDRGRPRPPRRAAAPRGAPAGQLAPGCDLGGQDGLVNILGIILGVIAGGGSIATLIGHLIPLLPFVWLPRTPALITAIVLSAGVLFGVGVYSSVTLVGDWRKNGLKMVTIGLGAAAAGFLIGRLFHTAGA